MRTIKSDSIAQLAARFACLGFSQADTDRLAKRIHEGPGGKSLHVFADIVHNSCRDSLEQDQDFLLRVTGPDLLLYGPKGYAVVDYNLSHVEFAFPYSERQSFADMTRPYRMDIAV